MSWVAEAKETSRVRSAITGTVGCPAFSANALTDATSMACPIRIQARLRPQRGAKRSISGDQTNLKAYGICAALISPMVLMSIPSCCIQYGTTYRTIPSGRPDGKERSVTTPVRQLVKARRSDSRVLSLSGGTLPRR